MHALKGVILVVVVSLCCCLSAADEWIDPYDMGSFDPSTNSMKGNPKNDDNGAQASASRSGNDKKQPTLAPGSTPQPQVELPKGDNPSCSKFASPCVSLFKQYVKSLLYHIRGLVQMGSEDINLRIKVTPADIEYLDGYSDPMAREQNFHLVHEILASMVKTASEVSYGDPSTQRLWIENVLGMTVEKFFMFTILAAIITITFYAAAKYHFSWWKLSVKLIFILFVISVFWQWYELYKKEEAKQHMAIMNEMPEGCRRQERDQGFITTIFRSLSTTFTFEKDECLKYYEHMLIDPFWRVTPTQALSKTLIRFFVAPARDLGEAIRDFVTGLLKDLPAQLWPVVLTAGSVFAFLLLFMYFGYKVSLPFGLVAVEPGSRADNSSLQRAIAEQKEELKAIKETQSNQLQQIMDTLKEDQKALHKQLENQQKFLALPGIQAQLTGLQSGDQVYNVRNIGRRAENDKMMTESQDETVGVQRPCAERMLSNNKFCESLVPKDSELVVSSTNLVKNSVEDERSKMQSDGIERDGKNDVYEGFQEISGDEVPVSIRKVSDAESYEEISVSNIEADTIGQRDN